MDLSQGIGVNNDPMDAFPVFFQDIKECLSGGAVEIPAELKVKIFAVSVYDCPEIGGHVLFPSLISHPYQDGAVFERI